MQKIFSNPFSLVSSGYNIIRDLPGLPGSQKDRAGGINTDHANIGVTFIKVFSNAADCAAGAHPNHDICDPALGLFPDLWARRWVVVVRILWIMVLVGENGIGSLRDGAFGDAVVEAWIFRGDSRGCDDLFRSEGAQQLEFLLAHLIGHDK